MRCGAARSSDLAAGQDQPTFGTGRNAGGVGVPGTDLADVLEHMFAFQPPRLRDVVLAIARGHGRPGNMDAMAHRVGFTNRYELARFLQRQGMPVYTELAGWVRVLGWLLALKNEKTSLASVALEEERNPAEYYRTVRRVVRSPWSEVKRRGSVWLGERFSQRIDECAACQRGLVGAAGTGQSMDAPRRWRRRGPT